MRCPVCERENREGAKFCKDAERYCPSTMRIIRLHPGEETDSHHSQPTASRHLPAAANTPDPSLLTAFRAPHAPRTSSPCPLFTQVRHSSLRCGDLLTPWWYPEQQVFLHGPHVVR
jgi:hypothetical protein